MHDLSEFTSWQKKQYVWKHNGLHGHIKRIQAQLRSLSEESMTDEALRLYTRTLTEIDKLQDEVWARRREPDGSITEVKHAESKVLTDEN